MAPVYIIFGIILGGILGFFLAFLLPSLLQISAFEGGAGYAAIYFAIVLIPGCALASAYYANKYITFGKVSIALSIIAIMFIKYNLGKAETPTQEIEIFVKNLTDTPVIGSFEDTSSKSYTHRPLEMGESYSLNSFPFYKGRSLEIVFSNTQEEIISRKTFIPYSQAPNFDGFKMVFTLKTDNSINLVFESTETNHD